MRVVQWLGRVSSAQPGGTSGRVQPRALVPGSAEVQMWRGGGAQGLVPIHRLGAVGRGRLGLGSRVPLERVLEELHAPGMERRDGQREGGMRAVEGMLPSLHPETGSGSAGPPCARTQPQSCPAWNSPLERDGDLRGWVGWRAQRESWQGRERVAELAVDAGGFLPTQPLQKQLLVERDLLQLADPLAPGRPLHGGGCCVPYRSCREWRGLEFAVRAALLWVAQTTSGFALGKGFPSVKLWVSNT